MIPDTEPLRGKYALTEKDFLEAQIRHAGFMNRVYEVTGAFMALIGILGLAIDPRHNFGGLVMIPIGSFLALRLRLGVRQSYKRDCKGRSDMEAFISESGIEFLSASGTSDFNWTAFTRYRETKHLFLVYMQSNIFNLIPKRAFGPPDLLIFRDILDRKLGAKSAVLNKRLSPRTIIFLAVIAVCVICLAVTVVVINKR